MKTDEEYFAIRNELKELKHLVNQFLDAIYHVPFRAVDCDQDTVEDLWEKLADAVDSDSTSARLEERIIAAVTKKRY